MIDYLLLKISEMALRAVKAPKAPVWKMIVYITEGRKQYTYLLEHHPIEIDHDPSSEWPYKLIFPVGTTICCAEEDYLEGMRAGENFIFADRCI